MAMASIKKNDVLTGENDGIRYKAFICYSHEDHRIASWLHHSIEHYRVPRPLIGQDGLSGPIERRLFPVFRDRDELGSSADLSKAIRTALEHSDFLIVVCSPHAAKSRWVNEEVLTFKRLDRSHRIIALIVRGQPNAENAQFSPEQECLPPALKFEIDSDGKLTGRFLDPLAADLRPQGDGRHNALLKVLSGLLGVRFDVLKHRDAISRRRRLINRAMLLGLSTVGAVSVLLTAMALFFGLSTMQFSNSFIFDGTVPRSVGPVRKRIGEKRADIIYVERQGSKGNLLQVFAGNAGGKACPPDGLPLLLPPFGVPPIVEPSATPLSIGVYAFSRPCMIKFQYNPSGYQPSGYTVQNQFEVVVATVKLQDNWGTLSIEGPSLPGLPQPGYRFTLQLERDPVGRIISVRFYNPDGSPGRIFGDNSRVDYSYDPGTGLISKVSYLTIGGQPAQSGFSRRSAFRLVYEPSGLLTELQGFDAYGVSGWAADRTEPPIRLFKYDRFGNRAAIVLADADRRSSADRNGVAEIDYTVRDGLLASVSYRKPDGNMIAAEAGRPCPEERFKYDAKSGQPNGIFVSIRMVNQFMTPRPVCMDGADCSTWQETG